MPQFLPFRGLRYDLGRLDAGLDALTAPPYDVIDEDLRARLEASHAENAVRLILPRDSSPDDRYRRAAETFATWRREGLLLADPPRLYLYRMTFRDDDGTPRTTSGVIGALALSPPGAGDVLPHERTMPKPKGDRLELLRAVRANLDPVWGLSLADGLSALLTPQGGAVAACTDHDGVAHEVWPIDDPDRIDAISHAVGGAPVVVADGHHRFETALAYRDERRAAGDGPGEHDQIMTFVVELADEELCVRPIHRLLGGLGPDLDLRAHLALAFAVHDAGPNEPDAVDALRVRMRDEHGLGLAEPGRLSLLVPRPDVVGPLLADLPAPVRVVDSAIVEVAALPGLDAGVSYRNDARAVAVLVGKGAYDAALLLKPVTVAQIHACADARERMPEKTSFFHPKPRTGLVFRPFDP